MNKKILNRLFLFLGTSLILSACGTESPKGAEEVFIDPIQYETPVADIYRAPLEADEPSTEVTVSDGTVNKIVIHYYNTDKKNNTRQIYAWTTGSDSSTTDMVIDSDDDSGDYYHVELDLTTDHQAYAGKSFINFIVKYKGTWTGQSLDTLLSFEVFKPNASGVVEVWACPDNGGSVAIYETKAETVQARVTNAYFKDWKTIHCVADEKPKTFRLYAYDKSYLTATDAVQKRTQATRLLKTGTPTSKDFDINFNYIAHVNVQYVVETEYESHDKTKSIIVTSYNLYEDKNFETYYTYNGDDLGCTYGSDKTTFKVWAPTAGAVILNVYNKGTPKTPGNKQSGNIHISYPMTMQPGGVWEKTLLTTGYDEYEPEQTLNGKYYTYTIYNSEGVNEVCDPYAKACGVNGIRGMILDFSTTNPEGWDNIPLKWDGTEDRDIKTPQELSIYEIHVRDLTADETWDNNPDFEEEERGTYKAFAQKGTTYIGKNLAGKDVTVKTGFDHIEELGVNAIQLMPVYDQDNNEFYYYYKRDDEGNPTQEQVYVQRSYDGDEELHYDYNWGYNPLNYNCVEGGYSSNPEDGALRVKEFKELIMAYANNANKTRTIMDVVYNHVSSVSNTNFTKIMPRYYFRFDVENDIYFDGSGCSNETKTEAPMMTKFVVDSLVWWATEYKIKGFRFDLMELISSKVLDAAREKLYAIDPDIYMYGEGWSLGFNGKWDPDNGYTNGSTYSIYKYQQPAANKVLLGGFNNGGRDNFKGGNDQDGYNGNHKPAWGFMSQGSGDVEDKATKVGQMLTGFNCYEEKNNPTQDARQTINYGSCHDNYTLYDQFSYTLTDGAVSETSAANAPSVTNVMDASITVNCSVMMSNGVAFMLGGEEIFRTKVEDHPELSRYDEDYVKMHGVCISHNSYKSSDFTNSFKWNRKILVEGYNGSKADNYAMSIYQKAISLRKEIAKNNLFTTGSKNSDSSKCNYFNAGGTSLAFYLGGYVTFISGRGDSSVAWVDKASQKLNSVGAYVNKEGGTVYLGKYAFGTYEAV